MSETHSKPLCGYPDGATVKVEDLCGGRGARSRLYSLGLTPGTVLEVVSGGNGPCRLKVRGSDLVLGSGLAEKVFVCPAECDCK